MSNQLAIAALCDKPARPVRARRTAAKPSAPIDTTPREIDAVITPGDYEHRIDRIGRPYAWVRGTFTYRKTEKTRTVMVSGEAYVAMRHLLEVGTHIKIRCVRERIVNKETGLPGAEVIRALAMLKVFDAEMRELDGTTGLPLRTVAGHERKGHYRPQRHGPGNSLSKIVWIDDVEVNGGRLAA